MKSKNDFGPVSRCKHNSHNPSLYLIQQFIILHPSHSHMADVNVNTSCWYHHLASAAQNPDNYKLQFYKIKTKRQQQ